MDSNSAIESENLNVQPADKALTEPAHDRLGYALFAKHLADSLCQMNFAEGFIIAVYGSSCSGKSTLVNFLVHYLKQKPEKEQPMIVPFNPWVFSGHDDITKRFFDQFQTVLSQRKYVPKGLKDRIADLGNIISEIPVPYAQAGNVVAKLFDNKQKDTDDLKEEVEDTLEQQHPRTVVTIDDIDRLEADEIKQLFRILKAFPDFTNVVYVLVFDKEVVIKALGETQGVSAATYLEKTVQVAFDLPSPDKILLRKLLFEKLNAVLADTPKHLFAQTRWANIYFQGIEHFITNLRDIVRLTNTLSVTYPSVKGEVNSVDFIAIEALRVFCPIMYDIIRKNPKAFAGQADEQSFPGYTVDELKSVHNSWLAQLQDNDKEPVKQLLLRLFPKLEAVFGDNYYAAQQESTWRTQLRICSFEVFPIYFRLTLPEVELSNTEMKAILSLAKDAKAFGKHLVELANQKHFDGTTEVRIFLEQLEDYTEQEIPVDCIFSIVQALYDVGDRLLRPEDEPEGMFDFGNDIRIERIISKLLRRLDEPARFEVLKETISNGNALSIIVRTVATLGQQQGKYGVDESSPEEEWLISEEHLKEIEKIALNKLRDAAEHNFLLQAPNLPEKLYYWQNWAEEEVKQWVQGMIANDEGLVNFLEKFLEKTFSKSGSDGIKEIYRLDPKSLEPYLDPSLVIDRIRSFDENTEFTENQTTALRQFIEEYDLREQGKDPNEPLVGEND